MNELLEKVKTIPHLPLSFVFDAKRMEDEIIAMPFPLMSYNANIQKGYNHSPDGWNNLSLYSYDGSMFCDTNEGDGGNALLERFGKFQKTGLTEYLPYTYEVLEAIGAGKSLCRIEEVMPNTIIGWHSHVLEFHQPENILIAQLPISIPEGFKNSVVDYRNYRGSDFSIEPIVSYDSKYVEGTPYIFNSYHYHNVFNYSNKPALMIRFFVDIEDLDIKPAIESYSGDLIVGLPK
jgi:hypothetical protein